MQHPGVGRPSGMLQQELILRKHFSGIVAKMPKGTEDAGWDVLLHNLCKQCKVMPWRHYMRIWVVVVKIMALL